MNRSEVTVLDGGMGQELRRRSNRPASPLWSAQVMLDEPDLVVQAHRDFIDAGARVITLNTYSATPQRLARDADPGLLERCMLLRWMQPAKLVNKAARMSASQVVCLRLLRATVPKLYLTMLHLCGPTAR